jgi:hypothetical protein
MQECFETSPCLALKWIWMQQQVNSRHTANETTTWQQQQLDQSAVTQVPS